MQLQVVIISVREREIARLREKARLARELFIKIN